MKTKQYEFYGVDFKTELLFGLFTALVLIIVWFGMVYAYYTFNHLDSVVRVPKRVFFGSMFLGLSLSLLLLRLVGKYGRRVWKITTLEEHMTIAFKTKQDKVLYNEINKMTLNGNDEIRYLTLWYEKEVIKIRVGTQRFMPFSTKEDIGMVDSFWNELEALLPNKYVSKKLNHALLPTGTISVSYKG